MGGPTFPMICACTLALPLIAGCELSAARSGVPGASGAGARYSRTLTASDGIEGLHRLRCETANGDLDIRAVPGEMVEVKAVVTARGDFPAETLQHWADQVRITTQREGDLLIVHPEVPGEPPRNLSLQVSLALQAPPELALDLESKNGEVTVTGTRAGVKASSGNGDLTLTDLSGAVTADTGSGAIRLERIRGAARVRTRNGDVTLAEIAEGASAETRSGKITATDLSGGLEASSGNGDLEIRNVQGSLTARSASGSVTARQVNAATHRVELHSGNGNIRFSGRAGMLLADSASGAVDVELTHVPRETKLTSGNGNVNAVLPRASDVEIEAATGNGSLDLDGLRDLLSAPPRPDILSWSGRLGSGGAKLHLRSRSGDVRISHR